MANGPIPWPEHWAPFLGLRVTVDGTALDAKLGALLSGDGPEVWIDGLAAWPEGFYRGGKQGRRVRVTGTVIQRDDLPVFVPVPGEPVRSGIPLPEGVDLDAARRRILLQDARWETLD